MSNRAPFAPLSAAWQAEQARKRAAYEESRRIWTQAWLNDEAPEPPTDTDPPNRRSRTIHDKRQFRFNL
jgi:hypothetical protein